MSAKGSLAAWVDKETRAERARLAASPAIVALRAGTLPRAAREPFAEALATIWAALAESAASTSDPFFRACWAASAPLRDPAPPRAARPRPLLTPHVHALMLAEEIALRARRDPSSLAGYLYALGELVPGPVGGPTPFVAALDTAPATPALRRRVVVAARDGLDGLAGLADTLLATDTRDVRGATLNPDAGNHPVADDPREIRAALRAGVRTWERFPYYEWRYGRRGRRFTRSDSAWLVTLAGLPQVTVARQIGWLGRLLAARGMPRWLLEEHLLALHEELIGAVPDRRAEYAVLLTAAHALRRQRTIVLGDGTWRALAAAFAVAAGPDLSRRLPEAGDLLLAAVADEAAGVAHAVSSLLDWLADPARFPEQWVAAADEPVAEARRLAVRD